MTAPDPTTRQRRLVRRLARLFRIERAGGFARRPAETIWRLVARRGALMAELTALERHRRAQPGAPAPELSAAVRDLAREVTLSRAFGEALAAGLGAELRVRRGEGAATGLRAGAGGRLLGSG